MEKKGLFKVIILISLFLVVAFIFGSVIILKNNKVIDTNNNSKTEGSNVNVSSGGLGNGGLGEEIVSYGFNKSIVYRDFSSLVVHPNEEIQVMIHSIIFGDENFFILEEYIPEGGEIIDSNGGETSSPNRLAWYSFSGIPLEDFTITYTIKAPTIPDTYTFEGVYGFESMNGSIENTLGETTITVA